MKRCSVVLLSIFLACGLAAQGQLNYGSLPRHHIVSPGDCLWYLANYYLGNPYQWPVIWEANRDIIRDPHWIYPGQKLIIPPTGPTHVAWELTDLPASVEITAADLPEKAVAYDLAFRCGYLTERQFNENPAIVSIVDPDQNQIFNGIDVFIDGGTDRNFQPGEKLVIFDLNAGVNSYRDGRYMGNLVDIKGILTIKEVFDRSSICTITHSFTDSLEMGDHLAAYQAPEIPLDVTLLPAEIQTNAYICAIKENYGVLKPYAFVYVDVGSASGIAVGDIFEIVKPEQTVSHPNTGRAVHIPEIVVGHVQVVHVQDRSCSGYVVDITNRTDLMVGDKLRLWAKCTPPPSPLSLEF
ncbi:MAG: hypothetical protein APR63_03340 [Desulfuromonas sp. SDB]|nr:MAG: hypothetical protein APR63_03340 [Desulfuromonas sp. SDB]